MQLRIFNGNHLDGPTLHFAHFHWIGWKTDKGLQWTKQSSEMKEAICRAFGKEDHLLQFCPGLLSNMWHWGEWGHGLEQAVHWDVLPGARNLPAKAKVGLAAVLSTPHTGCPTTQFTCRYCHSQSLCISSTFAQVTFQTRISSTNLFGKVLHTVITFPGV